MTYPESYYPPGGILIQPEETVQAPSGIWTVAVSPADALTTTGPFPLWQTAQPCAVIATSRTKSTLTPAGKAAVIAYMASYLTATNIQAQTTRIGSGAVGHGGFVALTAGSFSMEIQPTDIPTVVAAVVALLQTSGNVT